MHPFASLRIGLESLRANPLRAVLSTLGIIMGVGSMVSVLALGDGAEVLAREQIETTTSLHAIGLSPRTTEVVDGVRLPRVDTVRLGSEDAASLREAIGPSARVLLSIGGAVRFPDPLSGESRAARVTGVSGLPEGADAIPVLAGRTVGPGDVAGPATGAAVLSLALAETLFGEGWATRAVGAEIRWQTGASRIVGVIDPPGERVLAAFFGFEDARALLEANGSSARAAANIEAETIEDVPVLRDRAAAWADERFEAGREALDIVTAAGRVEQARQALMIFKILMAAITSVSLVVGGVGVMNILLASVAERTREIGVRRAVGARRRDLLTQFLSESVAITGVGSLLGVGLGLLVAWIATAIMRARTGAPVHPALTWQTFAFAVGAAVAVGLVFGTYPAIRAARLSPTDAIHHD